MTHQAPVVQVVAHGPTRAAARLWRFRGQLRVTVIAKATFKLAHQALMTIASPDAVVSADVHHRNNPTRSVRLTSDLAPYLPRADVVVNGHARAPREKVSSLIVGFGVFDRYESILQKHLEVTGDVGPGGAVEPFESIPLIYEKAYGGPGWVENPLGTGVGGVAGAPNVTYIGEPRRTAGFGPLPSAWPTRRRLLPPDGRKAVEAALAEIPEAFDWSYFQAAPLDQRCDFLQGSEWIVIEGMTAGEPRLRSRLPAAKGRARVHWANGRADDAEPFDLVADTLYIDADRRTCSVTWRKSFAVADEAAVPHLRIAAGVEFAGLPIPWSEPPRAADPAKAPEPLARELEASITMTVDDADLEIMSVDGSGIEVVAPVPSQRRPAVRVPQSAPSAFRLEVISDEYTEDPDNPLLSTLIIEDGPRAAGTGDSRQTTSKPTDRSGAAPNAPARLGPGGTQVLGDDDDEPNT